jgi:pyruvate dehydrogenase E2 component (dihydrolipoamide acetyltransferase)
MPFEFKFPDIGEGLTEGEIVRWLVKEGDEVKEGQALVEVETDKALAEIPSPRTGVVLKILAKEKEIIKVGQVIVVIAEKGEAVAAPPPKPEAAAPKPSVGVVGELEEAPEEVPVSATKPQPVRPVLVSPHVLATPAVRALAKELGVAIDQVKGSGPEGRVLEKDVRQAPGTIEKVVEAPKKARKYDLYGYVDRIPLRVLALHRKATVKSMYTHVTTMDEADVTLVKIRKGEEGREKESTDNPPFIVRRLSI